MAIYTVLDRKTLASLATDYGLGKLSKAAGVPAGSVNTHYLLETRKGKFFLKIDEVKSQLEAQRELDLLLFLRAQRFLCPQPLADRQGRYLHDHDDTAFGLLYVGGNGCWEVLSREPMLRSRIFRRVRFGPMTHATYSK